MTSVPTRNEAEGAPVETSEADVYVLGDGEVGVAITRRLMEKGYSVALIDGSYEHSVVSLRRMDSMDVQTLKEAGLGAASTVIVATQSDSRNLLLAQQVRIRFDVDRVLVLANEPERAELLDDAGHDSICATSHLANAIVDHL